METAFSIWSLSCRWLRLLCELFLHIFTFLISQISLKAYIKQCMLTKMIISEIKCIRWIHSSVEVTVCIKIKERKVFKLNLKWKSLCAVCIFYVIHFLLFQHFVQFLPSTQSSKPWLLELLETSRDPTVSSTTTTHDRDLENDLILDIAASLPPYLYLVNNLHSNRSIQLDKVVSKHYKWNIF